MGQVIRRRVTEEWIECESDADMADSAEDEADDSADDGVDDVADDEATVEQPARSHRWPDPASKVGNE